MIYFQLFLSFFQIGLLSFGGGYAAMPLIQGQVVQGHGWLSMSEFTDLITISQMTPGPIAVNSATFVGIKIAGIPGALVATFGCILPSCILVTLLAKLYLKYREMAMLQGILRSLRPAVVAMIGSAGISILVTAFWSSEGDTVIRLAQTNWSLVVIFIISLILLQNRFICLIVFFFIFSISAFIQQEFSQINIFLLSGHHIKFSKRHFCNLMSRYNSNLSRFFSN
jgi:chromate transporter